MSNPTTVNSAFNSLGEEFCWHAENFAAIYGADLVDTVHILLAAAEVSPVDLHGYRELTPVAISETLASNTADRLTESLPQRLTHRAQKLVSDATSFSSHTHRAPSLRDIWVALSREECGSIAEIFEGLGIDRGELYRRVSGT